MSYSSLKLLLNDVGYTFSIGAFGFTKKRDDCSKWALWFGAYVPLGIRIDCDPIIFFCFGIDELLCYPFMLFRLGWIMLACFCISWVPTSDGFETSFTSWLLLSLLKNLCDCELTVDTGAITCLTRSDRYFFKPSCY